MIGIKMISLDKLAEVKRLLYYNYSFREIARQTGISRATIAEIYHHKIYRSRKNHLPLAERQANARNTVKLKYQPKIPYRDNLCCSLIFKQKSILAIEAGLHVPLEDR